MNSSNIQLLTTPTHTTKIKTEAGLSLWETRHSQVLKFIDTHNVGTMVDFGSSQCTLLQKVQRGMLVKKMIGVDIDLNIMQKAIQNLKPQTIQQDLQFQRNFDQTVELRHGSVLEKYESLRQLKIDLVTLVEVIEHIEEQFLQKLNQNVFYFLRPQFVWISTPNSEYNCLFNWEKGRKYRHDDHKFEWTRAQFQQYVDNICQKYNYQAKVTGVGESFIEEQKDKGFCSQIAIFERIDFSFQKNSMQNIGSQTQKNLRNHLFPIKDPEVLLKTIYSHTNYCWLSNKDHLIEIALKQVIYKMNDIFIPWSKLLEMLKRKAIFRKLAQQDDKWQYDYFLKDFISNLLHNQRLQLKCERDGVVKIQQITEKTSHQDEMIQERMDEEISEFNLKFMEQNLSIEKPQIDRQQGPILYKYDVDSLPSRRPKIQRKQINKKQESPQCSEQSSNYSLSGMQSSSSQNSWKSSQMPDQPPKKKVPKMKSKKFKHRKSAIKNQTQDLN